MHGRGWAVLMRVQGLPLAHIIKGRLESEGIEVRLEYEALGRIYGLTVDGLGEVIILVKDDELERARDILKED